MQQHVNAISHPDLLCPALPMLLCCHWLGLGQIAFDSCTEMGDEEAAQRVDTGRVFECGLVLLAVLRRSVLAWRKWFHKQGGGGFWAASPSPAPDLAREQLLDRFHQHTLHCPACSKVRMCAREQRFM
jgi:hypothetical protein